ncbi:hypothetical protein L1987_29888 [Smallanthus sonchifolius]|uniref:Uncharacterized protein n=1 Tax=Smallanthus sonchifolius TaxID=185202 RepID=A0ACB9I0Q9_9ASTR|nr:hypothetical protein L1987_29888 [Smallanthus sonchifolius]
MEDNWTVELAIVFHEEDQLSTEKVISIGAAVTEINNNNNNDNDNDNDASLQTRKYCCLHLRVNTNKLEQSMPSLPPFSLFSLLSFFSL